jgi:hypothetical protein
MDTNAVVAQGGHALSYKAANEGVKRNNIRKLLGPSLRVHGLYSHSSLEQNDLAEDSPAD